MRSVLLLLALFSFASTTAYATDYASCAPEYNACDKSPTCAAFYTCQSAEHTFLNALILKAFHDLELSESITCRDKRDALETSLEAHATTIECVDTDNGPQFGG